MLLIYRKDTKEVVHHVNYDGVNVAPSLFGLYHACLKDNFPEMSLEDFGEFILEDSAKDENDNRLVPKLLDYFFVVEEDEEGIPVNAKPTIARVLSPPPEKPKQEIDLKVEQLEQKNAQLQVEKEELHAQLSQINTDFVAFMDYYFSVNPEL